VHDGRATESEIDHQAAAASNRTFDSISTRLPLTVCTSFDDADDRYTWCLYRIHPAVAVASGSMGP